MDELEIPWWRAKTSVTIRLYQEYDLSAYRQEAWAKINHVWRFHSYVKGGETFYVIHFNAKYNPDIRHKLVGWHGGEVVDLDSSNGSVAIPAYMVNSFHLGLETEDGFKFST